jgi:hypothetical protein
VSDLSSVFGLAGFGLLLTALTVLVAAIVAIAIEWWPKLRFHVTRADHQFHRLLVLGTLSGASHLAPPLCHIKRRRGAVF